MDVISYFAEEKIQNLICIILGSLSIIFSLIFLFIIKYSFYKGMAIPLLVFGLLQLVTGTLVFNRIPTDKLRVEQMIEQYPEKIATEELPRMQSLLQNFMIYQWIEIVLILAGLFLYIKFFKSPLTFWKGLGLGLILQVVIILSLDILAGNRATKYAQYLMTNKISSFQ